MSRPEPKFPSPLPRRMVVAALSHKYAKDCDEILDNFPEDKRVEMLEHMMGCLDIIAEYIKTPENEVWKRFSDKEGAFLKKHKSRLKLYRNKNLPAYYYAEMVLGEKDIYTDKEYNSLTYEEQALSPKEMDQFIRSCKNYLNNTRDMTLLNEDPDGEEVENPGSTKSGFSRSRQVLLLYYLLKTLGIKAPRDIPLRDMAKFFHSMLGWEYTDIDNSTLYKQLKKTSHVKENRKNLYEDLNWVRQQFEMIGLKEAIEMIDAKMKEVKQDKA